MSVRGTIRRVTSCTCTDDRVKHISLAMPSRNHVRASEVHGLASRGASCELRVQSRAHLRAPRERERGLHVPGYLDRTATTLTASMAGGLQLHGEG
jgi:hypothetical protein